MAGRIRDEDIALVRERSPIDEVVGEYLQLRNAGGGSLKGLCPFHDEKTPSFNVTPARGLFYCFSCAQGGDVIKFVQDIDGLSFVEAIEKLAGRAGVELRYEQGGYVPGQVADGPHQPAAEPVPGASVPLPGQPGRDQLGVGEAAPAQVPGQVLPGLRRVTDTEPLDVAELEAALGQEGTRVSGV